MEMQISVNLRGLRAARLMVAIIMFSVIAWPVQAVADGLELIPTQVFGKEDGDADELFGKITDIAIGPAGEVYVADQSLDLIRVYNASGDFQESIGRSGEAPGEFDRITSLCIDEFGNLLVVDSRSAHIFGPDRKIQNSFLVGSGGRGAVSVSGGPNQSILMTWFDIWNQKVIQQYSYGGERIASYSASLGYGLDMDVRKERTFAGGYVDFSPTLGKFLYAQLVPFKLRVFDADGSQLLEATGGHRELDREPFYEKTDGGARSAKPTRSKGAYWLPDGKIFHSTINRDLGDDPNWFVVAEVFSERGEPLGMSVIQGLVHFRATDNEGNVYGYAPEPFPQVRKYQVQVVER